MDDIVDYTEDISNGRHTLLTDKYPTAEELTINLRLLLLRIRKLIRKAKRCMPEYPPVVDLADRIEEFFKI